MWRIEYACAVSSICRSAAHARQFTAATARHEVDERGGRDQRDDERKRDGAPLRLRLACRGLFVEETAGLVALEVLHLQCLWL